MKKQFLSTVGTLLLAGVVFVPSTAPVFAAEKDAKIHPDWAVRFLDPGVAYFLVCYNDPNGLTIATQRIEIPSDQTVTLQLEDLEIPEGFYLNESFGIYQIDPGGSLNVELSVYPEDVQLAAVMEATEGLDPRACTLTFNYYDTEGALIASENYQKEHYRVGASIYDMYNGTDYLINVPEGYDLLSEVYDVYSVPYHSRMFVDVLVTPSTYEQTEDYSEYVPEEDYEIQPEEDLAAYAEEEPEDDLIFYEEQEVYEEETGAEYLSAPEETAEDYNSVNTALDSRIALPAGAMAASFLLAAWLKKRK